MAVKSQGGRLRTGAVADAYARWAPIYDVVFGQVFAHGRMAAIREAERAFGSRVLEVGVGTGLSLPRYRRDTRLVGIDISEPMLAKAREQVRRHGLTNVEELSVMDAERLAFPDEAFDVVVAQYVVTAVPNPERALDEFVRVVRPGGSIVLTSRIGADGGVRRIVERALSPVVNRLGWRTEFAWERYAGWAAGHGRVDIVVRHPLPPLGHFSLIRMTRTA